MKLKIQDTLYLRCRDKKILYYCYYAGYAFDIKKLIIFNDFKSVDQDDISILIQQEYIDEFINYKFKTKNKKIYIIPNNGYYEYLVIKEKITKLKQMGFDVSVITYEEWFEYDVNHYSFNRLTISKKNTLKKIHGISFKLKLRYYFPIIQSIYNALINIRFSLPLLFKSKVVYVGRASLQETIEAIDSLLSKKVITKHLQEKILNNLDHNKQKELFELIDDKEFKNLNFIWQYYIYNIVIRFLIISHLNKFKNFYHKTDKLFDLQLLRSNVYKKIFHIDFGIKCGNSFVGDRTIYLERFFKKRYLRINLFDKDINYNSGNYFKNRLLKIDNFLKMVYENKNFNLSFDELKNWLIFISDDFIDKNQKK